MKENGKNLKRELQLFCDFFPMSFRLGKSPQFCIIFSVKSFRCSCWKMFWAFNKNFLCPLKGPLFNTFVVTWDFISQIMQVLSEFSLLRSLFVPTHISDTCFASKSSNKFTQKPRICDQLLKLSGDLSNASWPEVIHWRKGKCPTSKSSQDLSGSSWNWA